MCSRRVRTAHHYQINQRNGAQCAPYVGFHVEVTLVVALLEYF